MAKRTLSQLLSLCTLVALSHSCGYIPSSCSGDLSWAVSSGKTSNPEYYPDFQSVTGTSLASATQDSMVMYWVCTGQNPNGNCAGLELPCSRSSCSDTSTDTSSGESLSVVTMNLFWWNLFGQRGGDNFFSVFSASGPYDLFFFQECDDVERIKNGLGYDLSTYAPARAVALAWSNSRFTVISQGYEDVAEDRYDQYYGPRTLVWARLRDSVTGTVVFAGSHHGPLPVDTGGATGGATVARRISEVVNYNAAASDVVILGGDFNAHDYAETMTTLVNTYGFSLRASDWVDHILTKGSALAYTPSINIISGTGSDHDGVKATWSYGLGSGSDDTSYVTPAPTLPCGYIPSSCSGDLSWAVSSGKTRSPQFYPYFEYVTGTVLASATEDEMVAYWVCTGQNPNGNCAGLELPCGWGSCSAQAQALEIEDLYTETTTEEVLEDDVEVGEDGNAVTDESEERQQWMVPVVICVAALAVICGALLVGVCYVKRRPKAMVGGVNDDEMEVKESGTSWDMSPVNVTAKQEEEAEEEEEQVLEVDVEVEVTGKDRYE